MAGTRVLRVMTGVPFLFSVYHAHFAQRKVSFPVEVTHYGLIVFGKENISDRLFTLFIARYYMN
jgi:hypothetical protein